MADQPQPPFVRSALSEPNGTGSTARLCTFLIVVCALAWVTYLVVRQTKLPELGALTVWVTTTTGTLYGGNKLITGLAARKDDSQ